MADDVTRRTVICREAWYYLVVLAFIVGGAILRNVNLLYILAGMMIGPILFNWRLVGMMMRRLRVERECADRVFAGQWLYVDVSVENGRNWLDSWAVSLADPIRRVDSDPTSASADRSDILVGRAYLPRIEVRRTVGASYRARLSRRGRYRIGPLTVSSRFPLGLVEARTTFRDTRELIVRPRIGQLTPQWTRLIDAERSGSVRSSRRSGPAEGDYYGLRQWQSGDSRRWIHWRTSAKLGTLTVRQYERRTNRDLTILVDLWQPEEPRRRHLANVELAASFAATCITDLCARGPCRLQLAIAGAVAVRRSGRASTVLHQELMDCLAVTPAAAENRLSDVIEDATRNADPDSSLIVITTRPLRMDDLRAAVGRRVASDAARIVNVGDDELERYFTLPKP